MVTGHANKKKIPNTQKWPFVARHRQTLTHVILVIVTLNLKIVSVHLFNTNETQLNSKQTRGKKILLHFTLEFKCHLKKMKSMTMNEFVLAIFY